MLMALDSSDGRFTLHRSSQVKLVCISVYQHTNIGGGVNSGINDYHVNITICGSLHRSPVHLSLISSGAFNIITLLKGENIETTLQNAILSTYSYNKTPDKLIIGQSLHDDLFDYLKTKQLVPSPQTV